MGALQFINFLLPLILTPYLIRVLGVTNFGLIAISQAVMSFFIIMADYGFNLTATRELAINREDPNLIEKLFREVVSTKLVLSVAGFFILFFAVFILSPDSKSIQLYLFAYSIVIGQFLMPLWFFQGMEDMKYITYFSIATKVISTLLILLIIRVPDHFVYVNLFYGIATITAGFFCMYFINRKYGISLKFCSLSAIADQLRNGWPIFVSNFTVNIYITSNIIVLGLFANNQVVGYYSIAEKVINGIRQLLVVFFQVVFPHMCVIASEAKQVINAFLKKVYIPFLFLITLFCILAFVFSEPIVLFFTGANNGYIELLIKVLSFVPLIVALNIPANQLLLAYNLSKRYSFVLVIGSCLNLLLNSILSFYFTALGTAAAVIITELFITISLYFALGNRNPMFTFPKQKALLNELK